MRRPGTLFGVEWPAVAALLFRFVVVTIFFSFFLLLQGTSKVDIVGQSNEAKRHTDVSVNVIIHCMLNKHASERYLHVN